MAHGIICPSDWIALCEDCNIITNERKPVHLDQFYHWICVALGRCLAQFPSGKVALALSGGLDSSVLATVLAQNGVDFTPVTIAGMDDHPDVVHAKILTQHMGLTDKHIVRIVSRTTETDMYDILFRTMHALNFHNVICGDCIDEMLGGYWPHQSAKSFLNGQFSRKAIFKRFWQELRPKHLNPLNQYATQHGVSVALPYLAAKEKLVTIPMTQRVNSRARKIIMRRLAVRLGIPAEIIQRPKYGLVNILQKDR